MLPNNSNKKKNEPPVHCSRGEHFEVLMLEFQWMFYCQTNYKKKKTEEICQNGENK